MRFSSPRLVARVVGLLLGGVCLAVIAMDARAQKPTGWTTLLDSKNMGNWTKVGEANWRMEDGALVADKGKSAHLLSPQSYKDFMIRAEFWVTPEGNTGIFIRCSDPKRISSKTCYEVNIWDTRPDPSYGTGAIVSFAEVNPMRKVAGKWSTMEITAKGRHLVVKVNGRKTVDFRNGLFEEGPFTLQYGGGVVKFRKVEIKPL